MKKDERIKRCPFCGSTDVRAVWMNSAFFFSWSVQCMRCQSNSAWFKTREKAIAFWNRRRESRFRKGGLLPCPFCGSTNLINGRMTPDSWSFIFCKDCGGGVRTFKTEEEAVEAWNSRYHSLYEGERDGK